MLRIHKPFSKSKLLLISITSICITSSFLGISILTYTPELSHAETVVYPEKETRTMGGITYMQDITPQICANTPEADINGNNQYQLIDKRDSKTYWVAKLKDNNCWMTQNLALNLSISKELTSVDSDVEDSWIPPENTKTGTISKSSTTFSYNPGEYIYTDPIKLNDCGGPGSGGGKPQLAVCPGWSSAPGLSRNTSRDVRSHYLAGNYYSGNIVTAEYDRNNGERALASICPSGWTLPTGGKSGQFSILAAGLNASYNSELNNIKAAPYYFVSGGYIPTPNSVYPGLLHAGDGGYWWSSTFGSGTNSYALYTSIFSPDALFNIQTALSARCVALGGEKNYDNVKVDINSQLSMDIVDEVTVEKSEANLSTVDLEVKVSSNQPYTVTFSSNDPVMRSSTASVAIPAKGGLLNTAENGWGIKLKESSEFMAVTNDLQTFYTASGAEVKTIPFTIGISTSPDIPNGEYSTDITVTATQN